MSGWFHTAVVYGLIGLVGCTSASSPSGGASSSGRGLGQGVAGPASPPTVAGAAAIVERSASVMRSFAQVALAADKDCERMASDLSAWARAHRDELEHLFDRAMEIPEAQRAELMRAELNGDEDVWRGLAALGACEQHAGVSAVLGEVRAVFY